jgi:hypothetical protein
MFRILMTASLCFLFLAGCSNSTSSPTSDDAHRESKAGSDTKNAEIKTNLAKLDPKDRELAEAQRVCPISSGALGSMGTPIKLTFADGVAFICCESCEKKARKDEAETLRKVADLKKK